MPSCDTVSTCTMSSPSEIIEREKTTYREKFFRAPDSDWPPDVCAVYRSLLHRIFEEGLNAQMIVAELGIRTNDIYSRFKHYTGCGIKEPMVHHRLRLAKRLLQNTSLSVTQIAFAIGYASPSGFCTTFRRYENCTPTEFRQYEQG